MFYELASDTLGEEELAALRAVIDSGRFTMGPRVAEFESAFASYHGVRHAVMVNSGSSANLVAVAALCHRRDAPIQRGDEAIVPAISWSTTYSPLQQHGLRLRVVDVDRHTLNIDPTRLEAALTPRTRLVVGVSILGNPAPLDALAAFADRHRLVLMEDNCESMDAEIDGRKTGTFGLVNTFSFFFSHQVTTMEGGMILTDDDEVADLARCLRAHGWTRDLPSDTTLIERSADDFFEAYRFVLPGYNVRPLEFAGAVGIEQLRKLPAMTAQRRRNWARFQALFADDPRLITQRENGRSSSFAFTIILDPDRGPDRSRVLDALREADIGFRIITGGCFTRHDAIRHYDHEVVGSLKNAELAHDQGFFVANAPVDLTPQLERLREVIDACCN